MADCCSERLRPRSERRREDPSRQVLGPLDPSFASAGRPRAESPHSRVGTSFMGAHRHRGGLFRNRAANQRPGSTSKRSTSRALPPRSRRPRCDVVRMAPGEDVEAELDAASVLSKIKDEVLTWTAQNGLLMRMDAKVPLLDELGDRDRLMAPIRR